MLFHEGQFLRSCDEKYRNFSARHSTHCQRKNCYTKTLSFFDGIESENDLMNTSFGQYGEMNNAWTSDDAKGFIKILEMLKTYFHR
jgi:argininosuccinate synthase